MPKFLTLIARALRGEHLTPAERGVYRFLKTLLLSAIAEGVVAGIEYLYSLRTGEPFKLSNLISLTTLAVGASLLHGIQQWAQANKDTPLGPVLKTFFGAEPKPLRPMTGTLTPSPAPALPKQPLLPMGATYIGTSPFSVADALATPANTNPAAPIIPSLPLPTGVTSNATPAYLAPDEPMDAKATLPTLATVFKRAAVSAPLADVASAQGKNDAKQPDLDAPADDAKAS